MRVNDLSKELKVSNTDILCALHKQEINKKHSSNLTDEEEDMLRHIFINNDREVLTFDAIKKDIPKVVDYLEKTFFTNSTITMMGDDYIKNSVVDRLSQVVLLDENIVNLNTDPNTLHKAMLRASLSEKDVTFILNTSLKISDVSVNIGDTKKEEDKETPENVDKMVNAKTQMMGSLESLIGIIQDNLGSSRIVPIASEESLLNCHANGLTPDLAVRDMLSIEKPLEFNLDYLDLSKIDNAHIFDFLNSLMAVDSNSSLTVIFPIDALVDSLKEFYAIDLAVIGQAAVDYARQSSKNSVLFVSEQDPFKSLFATL